MIRATFLLPPSFLLHSIFFTQEQRSAVDEAHKASMLPFAILLVLLCAANWSWAQEWEYLGLPPNSDLTRITSIAALSADIIYASTYDNGAGGPGNIFRTTNGGATWDTLVSASTQCLSIHPRDEQIILAGLGSVDGPLGILKSTDGGDSWFHADSGIFLTGYEWPRVIAFDPVHPETLYAGMSGFGGGNLYKSTNGGTSWTEIRPLLSNGSNFIAIDPLSTDTIYVLDSTGAGLFKSTNGGNDWVETNLPNGGHGLNGLALDPINPNTVYVGIGGGFGFYRSTDGGETWEHMTSGLPEAGTGEIVVNQFTREVFAVAFPYFEGDIFRSTDLGNTWAPLGGLPTGLWPNTMSISADQTKLLVGRSDLGIYSTTILVTDIGWSQDQLPNTADVAQNYPNPFNPKTEIRFRITEGGLVSLRIYNVLGKEVAVLVDERIAPGEHSREWDATGQPSGVYFYRLLTNDFVQTKKLVLLR